MTNQEILEKLSHVRKGCYISLTKAKDLGNGILKESDMHIRLGVNYANMSINKDKQTGSLPWGHWVEGLENLALEHKGKYYLRVSSTTPENPDSGADTIATRYYHNGVEVSREEALQIAEPKNTKSSSSPVYNIKFENIIRLGIKVN